MGNKVTWLGALLVRIQRAICLTVALLYGYYSGSYIAGLLVNPDNNMKEEFAMARLNQAEKAKLLDALLNSGIITKETLEKGIVGKQEPKGLGAFKDTKGNTIEVSTWYDKEGVEYISQTKIIPSGVRTKGFAIEVKDFKKYVSLLNSIADKLGK